MDLPTKNLYLKAIENLKLGMIQLEPDGNCCSVCGDDGHQAWECHHNPLSRNYMYREHWRCFHCNQIFYNVDDAHEHFGDSEKDEPSSCRNRLIYLKRWAEKKKHNIIEKYPEDNIDKQTLNDNWTSIINKINDLLILR